MGKSYSEILAEETGFSDHGPVKMEALICRNDVRDMCRDGKCKRYGRSWSCPPACGTIEENSARLKEYSRGIILETVGQLEDEFDIEGMKAAEELHKKHFYEYVTQFRAIFPGCLPLGAGSCSVCAECTYPQSPCRFPERQFTSMEAYGLWVSDVCERSGIKYNHGKNTITYVSCVLF